MTFPTTTQFHSASTPSGKRAFEAWCAVYTNFGEHIMIAAPTLEALDKAYVQIVERPLIREAAQHVWIVAFSTLDDAPHDKPAPANVKCSVLGCAKQASFIIHKIAYCKEHRGVAR